MKTHQWIIDCSPIMCLYRIINILRLNTKRNEWHLILFRFRRMISATWSHGDKANILIMSYNDQIHHNYEIAMLRCMIIWEVMNIREAFWMKTCRVIDICYNLLEFLNFLIISHLMWPYLNEQNACISRYNKPFQILHWESWKKIDLNAPPEVNVVYIILLISDFTLVVCSAYLEFNCCKRSVLCSCG